MKKEMMKRIGMPSAKKPMEAEMEMEFEPADMEEMPEGEMPMEGEEGAPEASSLMADMKDEDILAELEARGYDVSMLAEPMPEEGEEEAAPEEAPMPPKAKGKLPA